MFAWTWRIDPRALKNQEISKMVNMKNSMVHTNLNVTLNALNNCLF